MCPRRALLLSSLVALGLGACLDFDAAKIAYCQRPENRSKIDCLALLGPQDAGADPADGGPEDSGSADAGFDAGAQDAGACHNGFLDPGEACDDGLLTGQCTDAGNFYAGALLCSSCVIDKSGCFGPPSVPALTAPPSNQYLPRQGANARRPLFTWQPSTLSGPSASVSYELQLGTDPQFGAGVTQNVATSFTNHQPSSDLLVSSAPPVGGQYFWRVRSCANGNVCSAWSHPWSVHVGRSARDYNGDGFDDVVVSSIYGDGGQVVVYQGGAGFPDAGRLVLNGGGGVNIGYQVSGAGDVNGDGYADLLVSAGNIMRVYLGGPNGPFTGAPLLLDAGTGVTLGGLAAAGDVNGDGVGDIIVGAASLNDALLFYGRRPSGPDGVPDGVLQESAESYAYVVGGVGDLNRDGFGDVVVGAPHVSVTSPGEAFVYFGSPGASFDKVADGRFSGLATGDQFGFAVCGGDLDADGYSDAVIAAPTYTPATGFGVLLVYKGHPGTTFHLDAGHDLAVQRPSGGVYGNGLSCTVGDVDGDGAADLVTGAPYESGGAGVYLGGAAFDGFVDAFVPGGTNHRAGWDVGVADATGDGLMELVVGAPRVDMANTEGYLFVSRGSAAAQVPNGDLVPSWPTTWVFSADAGLGFGWSVAP